MGKEDKKEPFLTNLGRATMRGLRRCKKCGTLNGTRGYTCKNKNCDVVFKEAGEKKKSSAEPCKILTGTSVQIYSVRVRDKGPDYRGFVQLPMRSPEFSKEIMFPAEDVLLVRAKCFVESCQKMQKYATVPNSSPCNHIKSSTECYKEAQPLPFKNSILNTFPIPPEFKDEMYQLATDTAGPLVQRVSKSLFVVKCKPDSLHPLGFLHFSFTQAKNKKEGEPKFYCSCRTFKFPPAKEAYRKCVHLYACIVVFASEDRLITEFSYYIDLIRNKDNPRNLHLDLVVSKEELDSEVEIEEGQDSIDEEGRTPEEVSEEVRESSFFILNDTSTGTPCEVEVEVVGSDGSLMELPISGSDTVCTETDEGLHLHTSDGGTISVHHISDNISLSGLKRKADESIVQASSALLTLQKATNKKMESKRAFVSSKRLCDGFEESEVSLSFPSWIASVAERINQSLHYGFPGKPDPLVFHLPKIFFDCLMNRINKTIGSKKRKLIQETQNFIRKDAVPLGKFTKYTWKITTLEHVQEIFSNAEIPLEPVRYFSLQKDGSYKACNMPQPPQNGSHGSQPIRPREYKTVLRVGLPCPVLLREVTPFIVEWIPDILSASHIGELRLKFEFDHYCNGQHVLKQPSILSSILSKSPLKSAKSLGPPLAPRPVQTKPLTTLSSNEGSLLSIPISSDNLSAGDSITLLTF